MKANQKNKKSSKKNNNLVLGVIAVIVIGIAALWWTYTYIEVLAVKSSDGTIRTAFNTCQVCYASGRGYYIQQGDGLIIFLTAKFRNKTIKNNEIYITE